MTKHFNVGEAKAKLSQLIAAAKRGEDVVIDHDGTPQVRLVKIDSVEGEARAERARKRASALGMWRDAFRTWPETSLGPSMTDEDVEARWKRKFAPPA